MQGRVLVYNMRSVVETRNHGQGKTTTTITTTTTRAFSGRDNSVSLEDPKAAEVRARAN